MKTVLAPNAPWPTKVPKAPRQRAERKRTDANFEAWVGKQKDVLLTGAMLGLTTKKDTPHAN